MRKTCIGRRKISLLKDQIRKRFEGKVFALVNDVPNLWAHFKVGVLRACDEVCEEKSERNSEEIHAGGMKR